METLVRWQEFVRNYAEIYKKKVFKRLTRIRVTNTSSTFFYYYYYYSTVSWTVVGIPGWILNKTHSNERAKVSGKIH